MKKRRGGKNGKEGCGMEERDERAEEGKNKMREEGKNKRRERGKGRGECGRKEEERAG